MLTNNQLGILYTLIGGFILSTGFIFGRIFLEFTDPISMIGLWFIGGSITATAIVFVRKDMNFLSVLRKHWKIGIVLGLTNAAAATFWAISLSVVGANVVAFIWRLSTLFIILLGVLFLKERLSGIEVIGAGIAIFGTLLLSLSGKSIGGLWLFLPLAGALFAALHHFASKMVISKAHPMILVQMRTMFSLLFIWLGILLFSLLTGTNQFKMVPLYLLPVIFVVGIFTAVIAFFLFYKSYAFIDVSKSAVMRTLEPFFVVMLVFIIFNEAPGSMDFVGGGLIVFGVVVSASHHKLRKPLRRIWRIPSWFD